MTRTIRRRFPVLFAAVALLALFGGLALPATAQAQSAGVLVSNIEKAQEGVGGSMNDRYLLAQSFSVPSVGGNYTLTSIEMLIGDDISSTNIGSLGVSVWSADASFNPDSSLHTLTNPASVAGDVAASFTAPTGATLEAGNTYFVVAYNDRDLFVGPVGRARIRMTKTRPPSPVGPSPIMACGVHLRTRAGVAGPTPSLSASTAPRWGAARPRPRS